jgi:hypothetical protein
LNRAFSLIFLSLATNTQIKYHQQGLTRSFYMNFQSFRTNMAAVTLTFKISKNFKKKTVWQMFPSTHLPNFIQISSAVSEKQGRDKANTG